MKSFNEYLKLHEGTPAGWRPSPPMSGSPFKSALMKILANVQRLPFNGNFGDKDVIKITFGLNPDEFAALDKSGLMIRTAGRGWNIDEMGFQKAKQQLGITGDGSIKPSITHISPPIPGKPGYSSNYKDWQATGGKMAVPPAPPS